MKQETIDRIRKFVSDRDWNQFHTPSNMAKSIAIEAAELLECFQWSDTEYDLQHVKEELADVMVYCQDMLDALGLDADEIVNMKMDQNEAKYPVEKAKDAGAKEVWLTERGNCFGYNNLVVDFRNIPDMLEIVPRVIMDCTHSVQRPGAGNGTTAGDRRFVPSMALAAKAFGATGYFFEVHPNPDKGLSDGPNMLQLNQLEQLITQILS